MRKAKVKIDEEFFPIEDDIITVGRASDNKIPLSGDSNISRYHAEIENRNGEFWLIELGSSNGTKLNGADVRGEILLEDGDKILLGGTGEIEFYFADDKSAEEEKSDADPKSSENKASNETPIAETVTEAKKSSSLLMPLIAGVVVLFALVAVTAAVFFAFRSNETGNSGGINIFGGSKCEAKAKITNPENGDNISKETEIKVSTENIECVSRAVFLLNDKEVGASETEPYGATLNPKDFPEFADGADDSLKIIFEDTSGNKINADEISLLIETAQIATPTPTPVEEEIPEPTVKPAQEKRASAVEVQNLTRQLIKKFPGNFAYKPDEQFIQEVTKRTSEFAAAEGFYSRADAYRDVIIYEFRKENGLDAPLGFWLAMSRSKFNPQKQGTNEGLWQLSDEFVTTNGYKTPCQAESLSDKTQNCAAKTAAVYTKALMLKVFNGDVVYGVAAFGMNEQEASAWYSSLPEKRENFWRVINDSKKREQVVKFFAAAIVAENPQKFGLKKDRPLTDLYRNLVTN